MYNQRIKTIGEEKGCTKALELWVNPYKETNKEAKTNAAAMKYFGLSLAGKALIFFTTFNNKAHVLWREG